MIESIAGWALWAVIFFAVIVWGAWGAMSLYDRVRGRE